VLIYTLEGKYIMKQKILKLIKTNPRGYAKAVKKDSRLFDWVIKNNLADTDHLPSMIRSAVYQETGVCTHGKKMKFTRISTGFSFCGPARICACTKEAISQSVKNTKAKYSCEDIDRQNKKRKQTMINTYGVCYNSQRQDLKHIWSRPKVSQAVYEKLSDKQWLKKQYIDCNRTAVDIADELGIYYSTVIEHCRSHGFAIKQTSNYSLVEKEISNYVRDLNFTIVSNDRSVLDGKEIDIYVPCKNLGIEVNGLYWHSCNKKINEVEPTTRHIDKTILAETKGVDLIHITDWEWRNKTHIIKSIIASKLGITEKIHARKTQVERLASKEARQFLAQNHLQGVCNSSVYFGLRYEKKLVQVMSAGQSRFNEDVVELHRLTALSGVTVVGGASKLLKTLKKYYGASTIKTYCDRDKSNGAVYKKLGFRKVGETGPGYFWTDGNEVVSRYRAQKQNLQRWLETYDQNLTESENMFQSGYRRYWNCGNLKFEI
jgi:hypothetical protein